MKQFIFLLMISALLCRCNEAENNYPKAENALDAGREFIDGCLKGDFKKAEFYMLKDAENEKQLNQLKRDYEMSSAADKEQYKTASIIINNEETINDSTHIIFYKNSFDKIARKVKLILRNSNWQVDFKYTTNGNL
ncbi:MAG: hypothetical protein ACR2FN_06440 [Chitinophagaceae bacterium]